jgi:Fur family zinc uptake transcriptional regulator
MTTTLDQFPESGHDHEQCVADALARAEEVCRARGVRLTDLRRRVLELVWDSHTPVGAYELLEKLRAERPGAAPPTVYRALDFLSEQGLVHRIEYLNAFIGCSDPGTAHAGQFLVCTGCGRALELHDGRIDAAIAGAAEGLGFEVLYRMVEVAGRCPACRGREAR